MDNSILNLILDYQASIEKVMSAFQSKYKRTDLLTAYRHDKLFSQIGNLNEFGIKRYAFHGIGLHATFQDNTTVDFDFAFLPEQRHDGFDLWRLSEYVLDQTPKYQKYLDKEKLKEDFTELVQNGSIINPKSSPSTTLYFFKDKLENSQNGR